MANTLDRIAKVLHQAENATTPGEADTYLAKAQEMARLSNIDLEVARLHTLDSQKREEVEKSRVVRLMPWDRKYHRKHFVDLFIAIADANDVEVIIQGGERSVKATGFPSDIDFCTALYNVLSVQMVTEASAALERGEHKRTERVHVTRREPNPRYTERYISPDPAPGWDESESYDPYFHRKTIDVPQYDDQGNPVIEERQVGIDGRTFRANFYKGFVARTSSRLVEARRAADKAAGLDTKADVALALRSRAEDVAKAKDEVDAEYLALNPRGYSFYSGASVSRWDTGGLTKGQDAAARADHGVDDHAMAQAAPKREI